MEEMNNEKDFQTSGTHTNEEKEKSPIEFEENKEDDKEKFEEPTNENEIDGDEVLDEEIDVNNLLDEIGNLQSQYLRTLAEYENYRKRTIKEKDTIRIDSENKMLFEVLPILDNIERGIETITDEKAKEGMELIARQFKDTLLKLGVEEIDCEEKEFNPDFHNAIMHIEDENLGDNVVAEVLQKGYIRNGNVIRYAMVKVAN